MTRHIFIILLYILTTFSGQTQSTFVAKNLKSNDSLNVIVSKIAAVNVVQSKHIGIGGTEGENFKNFETLKATATINELVLLTYNTNNAVACYAAMALADKSYKELDVVFKRFIDNKKIVETQNGCIRFTEKIYYKIYYYYLNKVDNKLKSTDTILYKLDELILKSNDTFLQEYARKNRKEK